MAWTSFPVEDLSEDLEAKMSEAAGEAVAEI